MAIYVVHVLLFRHCNILPLPDTGPNLHHGVPHLPARETAYRGAAGLPNCQVSQWTPEKLIYISQMDQQCISSEVRQIYKKFIHANSMVGKRAWSHCSLPISDNEICLFNAGMCNNTTTFCLPIRKRIPINLAICSKGKLICENIFCSLIIFYCCREQIEGFVKCDVLQPAVLC